MMFNIKTDEGLLNQLKAAAQQKLTKDQSRQQRVSFVFGNIPSDSTITRRQVEEIIGKIED